MKNKLIEVLQIQSESYNQFRMFAYLIRQLKKLGCQYYVDNGNIYATKGNASNYPCIVAHMDTVHDIVENLTVIEIAGNLTGFNRSTMQQTGIGGDDKVGIFIALQCVENFENIKVAFFRDEETGCNGSYDADVKFFNDCNFILQCDRKGNRDFVTNASGIKLSGKDFQKDIKYILKQYGYGCTNGMMTDVMALKEIGIECSMANISCGYYNPHCENEYVNVLDVINCLNMVIHIITQLKRKYVCKPDYRQQISKTYSFVSGNRKTKYADELWEDTKSGSKICECCNEDAETIFVSDYNIEMCDKCIKEYMKPYSI